jgi:hypothetical protein
MKLNEGAPMLFPAPAQVGHGGAVELAGKLTQSFTAILAVGSAVDGNMVLTFIAALASVGCLVWSKYRDQLAADQREKRDQLAADQRQKRLDAFEDAVNKARIAAIGAGKPDPYPNGLPFEAEVNQVAGAKA